MALFDWQGNELDRSQTPEWDGVTGFVIGGDELARVYAAQHEDAP